MVKHVAPFILLAACADGAAPGPPPVFVFSEQGDIYGMDSLGGNLTNLTRSPLPREDYEPAWSPDGSKIVFSTLFFPGNDGAFRHKLFVMNADGSGVRQLTFGEKVDVAPAWSPDGTKIAFASNRDSPSLDIYVMNVDGSGITRLAGDSTFDLGPTWSPDGRIAFRCDRSGQGDICIVNPSDGGLTQLGDSLWPDSGPAWSPDGNKIAFISIRETNYYQIWTMNANGSSPVRLTDSLSNWSPAWSPDASRIVFISTRNNYPEVYVMNADGSGQTRLTYSTAGKSSPRWRP